MRSYHSSEQLFERAQQLIPGGIHLSGTPLLPAGRAPLYMVRGQGARCWDADGNEFLDYAMAFGPFLLGYAHPEVNQAAIRQLEQGSLLSLNHPLHLEFVETLVRRFPSADMGVMFKTGSEATTAALRLARRHTGRRAVARCGYHGWHDWCLPLEDFVPAGLDAQVPEFDARQPATLRALMEQHSLAAVILSPEMIYPLERALFVELMDLAREHGAVFILDEVKTAFRTRPGSIQQHLDLQPDLTTLSKALGNGWPVAAVIGRAEVMRAGAGMHYSATFHGETAALAAALKVLEILDREPVAEQVWQRGERLIEGLNETARRHGISARAYGEPLPPMPFLKFEHPDPVVNQELIQGFYAQMLEQGILLHPRHMWFVSQAHSEADIEFTLKAADRAFTSALARQA